MTLSSLHQRCLHEVQRAFHGPSPVDCADHRILCRNVTEWAMVVNDAQLVDDYRRGQRTHERSRSATERIALSDWPRSIVSPVRPSAIASVFAPTSSASTSASSLGSFVNARPRREKLNHRFEPGLCHHIIDGDIPLRRAASGTRSCPAALDFEISASRSTRWCRATFGCTPTSSAT